MARGFDSKFIEAQQEEAVRAVSSKPGRTAAERDTEARRGTLQLARARAAADLTRATAQAHRRMLEQAIAALDAQLADLGGP